MVAAPISAMGEPKEIKPETLNSIPPFLVSQHVE